ncbi:MAG: DUF2264 domain-containing protein [Anaerolineae bacterium]
MNGYLDGVYCGDGWYDDAAARGPNYFDNYITWVFAMHVMAWAQMDGASMPARRDELLDRVRAWMRHFPYFFAADGSTVEYGRSLAYKFCRLGAPLWAYKLGIWDHPVGMLRRLVGRHLRWYVDRGAVRADGTLRQSLTASGSPDIIERYISTGATYWAMQAFSGLWSLPDDDPFWTAEETPLPLRAIRLRQGIPATRLGAGARRACPAVQRRGGASRLRQQVRQAGVARATRSTSVSTPGSRRWTAHCV